MLGPYARKAAALQITTVPHRRVSEARIGGVLPQSMNKNRPKPRPDRWSRRQQCCGVGLSAALQYTLVDGTRCSRYGLRGLIATGAD
eukprot:692413-Prymnesium_polylepis.1